MIQVNNFMGTSMSAEPPNAKETADQLVSPNVRRNIDISGGQPLSGDENKENTNVHNSNENKKKLMN